MRMGSKLSAVFYCGDESPYGVAHLAPLLKSDVIDITAVVLADFERWEMFRRAISGVDCSRGRLDALRFATRRRRISSTIKELKASCEIRVAHDANQEEIKPQSCDADLIISAAYPQIFSNKFLSKAKAGAINFHPSYLPRCRGAHPIYWTIAKREPYAGVSCHFMTEALDAGDLLAQRKIAIDPETITYRELYDAVIRETPLLIREVEIFFSDKLTPQKQRGEPTLFRNDREIHHKVFWGTEDSRDVSAKIRAGSAYSFTGCGDRIVFYPPVTVSSRSSMVTNGIETVIPSGTVVHSNHEVVTVRNQNEFLTCGYLAVERSSGCKTNVAAKAFRKLGYRRVISVGESLC